MTDLRTAPATPMHRPTAGALLCFAAGPLKDGTVLLLSVGLHLLVGLLLVSDLLRPMPAAAAPKLIEDSLEVVLAEDYATEITEAAAPPPAPTLPAPVPREAAFMTDALSPVALPPPPPSLPDPAFPPLTETVVPPALPVPDTLTAEAPPLPQIAFPPAEARPEPPKTSRGATARVDAPAMTTDPSRIPKEYPRQAREKGWQGIVVLKLTLDADSRLVRVETERSSGYRVLDSAARRAVRKARFTGGPGTLLQPIEYRLQPSAPPTP